MNHQKDVPDAHGPRAGSMLGVPVPAPPSPPPRVEHVQGVAALPRVIETLTRFEPAVLLTADGRGALHAPASDGDNPIRRFWLLADARTALEWEGARRHELTLTFQSRDACASVNCSPGISMYSP